MLQKQAENLFAKNSIRTFTGIYMNVFDPQISMICIEDIAHSLSQQCRFGGHLPDFYSVAQHCVLCSDFSQKEHALAALLHDASEAYLLDIPSPIKKKMIGYKRIENNLMHLIAENFGFQYPLHEKVQEVDRYMLAKEWDGVMLKNVYVECWTPKQAEYMFLNRFKALTFY